jgi:hypothetical protein
MRLLAPTPVFSMLAALVWGCTVYDTSLMGNGADLGSGATGADGGSGGSSSRSGSGNDSAGTKPSATAGTFGTDGGMATGGTFSPSEGGEPALDGGEGPLAGGSGGAAPEGGSAGSAGAAGKGGSGGSGGGAPTVKCADHPLTLKTTWKVSASHSSLGNMMESDGLYNPPIHAIDGSSSERWSTGKYQEGDEWFQVDFGAVSTITQVTLQVFGKDTADYPRGYAVRVSNADLDFNAAPVASGAGATGSTSITLAAPATGQYLLIRQTGITGESWWTIDELLVGCTD